MKKDEILTVISRTTPYDYKDLEWVYGKVKSYDALIEISKLATLLCRDIHSVVNDWLEPKLKKEDKVDFGWAEGMPDKYCPCGKCECEHAGNGYIMFEDGKVCRASKRLFGTAHYECCPILSKQIKPQTIIKVGDVWSCNCEKTRIIQKIDETRVNYLQFIGTPAQGGCSLDYFINENTEKKWNFNTED